MTSPELPNLGKLISRRVLGFRVTAIGKSQGLPEETRVKQGQSPIYSCRDRAHLYYSSMSRVARIVLAGVPHHVTQRGNNRQTVFFTDDDRRVYLELLGQQARRFGLAIQAYCLMPNHTHLIGVPCAENSLAQAVGRAHYFWFFAVLCG